MTKRLFLTFEAMGDAVMRCGTLRELAASSTLDLAGRRYLDVYADSPWIGRVIDASCLVRRRQLWLDRWLSGRMQLAEQLRSANYDEVIIYQRDGDRGLRTWLSRHLPAAHIREIPRSVGNPDEHATEEGRLILANLGLDARNFNPTPTLEISPARAAAGRARAHELAGARPICIQAGTALASPPPWWDLRKRRMGNPKGLPSATWSSVIDSLLASDLTSGIILIGSAAERSMAQSIVDGVTAGYRDQVTMAAVGLGVPETAALIRAAQVLISVDTGPAHIAAAVGARVLVLFGPTSQHRFAPRGPGVVRTLTHDVPCRPCFGTPQAKRCSDNICLRLMPVEQIVAAARSMLP